MPRPIDIAFAVLFAVVIALFEAIYFDKRFKAQVAHGVPNARRNAYRRSIIGQWSLSLLALVLWKSSGRSWSGLGIVPPLDWRLAAGIGIVVAMVFFTLQQVRAIRRIKPEARDALRQRLLDVAFVLPHTRAEHRWFTLLSLTAGCCEELLYRGFLTWLIASYTNLPAAILLSAIAFGLAHAYQGRKGILKTGAVGLVMGGIVFASGWLLPAMIVHALIDISAGEAALKAYHD